MASITASGWPACTRSPVADGQLDHRALERSDHGDLTVGQARRRRSGGRRGVGGLAEVEHGERVVGVEPGTGQPGLPPVAAAPVVG